MGLGQKKPQKTIKITVTAVAQNPDELGKELYSRFTAGDERAFEEIVALYRADLTRFLYSIVNDRFEAEDLMIDTFASLAEGQRFKGESSLKTYLFAIGRHHALRCLKKRKQKNHLSIEEILDEPLSKDDNPEADFLREDSKRRLLEGIKKLKPEYSEILRLLYFEEMSYASAALVMNKKIKQIDNLAYNAKLALKATLESESFSYED